MVTRSRYKQALSNSQTTESSEELLRVDDNGNRGIEDHLLLGVPSRYNSPINSRTPSPSGKHRNFKRLHDELEGMAERGESSTAAYTLPSRPRSSLGKEKQESSQDSQESLGSQTEPPSKRPRANPRSKKGAKAVSDATPTIKIDNESRSDTEDKPASSSKK